MARGGFHVYDGTGAEYLATGEAYLSDLLEHMEQAKRFIFLEYYIVARGEIFDRMLDIFRRKRAEGVEIKFLFDDFGSMMRMPEEAVEELRRIGAEVLIFNPVHHYVNRLYFNYRDHRKIACIDGETKASALGDYLPAKLGMDAGENVIWLCLPGDYSGSVVFFFENGRAARVALSAYATVSNRRKLTGAYCDKFPLVCAVHLTEDTELALETNEPRALLVHTSLLAPKTTRNVQGVAVMTLKPKYHLDRVLRRKAAS